MGPDGDNVLWLDIADLSDHCPIIPLQLLEVWLCQWPSLTGMEPLHSTHKSCTSRPPVLKERWQEDRTGSSSLNFFQVFFNHIVAESSQPPAAERLCWLCWGLTTCQPLWVICIVSQGKGEEIVEEMKEKVREEREQEWMWRNRRNKNIPPLPLPATRIAGLTQL